MADEFTLAQVAEITGAKPRTIQFWADNGVLVPSTATQRAGRGTHRRFSRAETIFATIVHGFARQNVSLGRLVQLAEQPQGDLCT